MYNILERITTDNLSKYLKIAGIKGGPSAKLKKIELLMEEFNKPGFVKKIYESLSTYEKEIVDTIVQYKYHPETKKLFEIREKYNPDNIFKNKNKEKEVEQIAEEITAIVEYKKENFIQKLLNKIKRLFTK